MKFMITTSGTCPYCDAAKALLEENDFEFTENKLVSAEAKENFKREFATVPQIWVQVAPMRGFTHIGGYTELRQFLANPPKLSKLHRNAQTSFCAL